MCAYVTHNLSVPRYPRFAQAVRLRLTPARSVPSMAMPNRKRVQPKQRDEFENQIAVDVGRNVAALMVERRINNKQIAGLLDCSERSVQAYIAGERRWSVADLVKLSTLFQCTIDRLVFGDGERPRLMVISQRS